MNVNNLLRLDGKVAIVTGGRGLFGASISEGLCEMGATVIIASRNGGKCEEFAATLRAKGYSAQGMALDLGDDRSIENLCDAVKLDYGGIDILVNNAFDRSNLVTLDGATREKLLHSYDVNVSGLLMLTQKAVVHMKEKGSGSIINISSMRGIDCPHFPFYPDTMQQRVNYTGEKWAQVGITKYMAGLYGKDHIRANCICPGGYDPELENNADPGKAGFYETYKKHCPLGRWANEDDIKGPVVFLASEASAYFTGSTLVMDGGWTIW